MATSLDIYNRLQPVKALIHQIIFGKNRHRINHIMASSSKKELISILEIIQSIQAFKWNIPQHMRQSLRRHKATLKDLDYQALKRGPKSALLSALQGIPSCIKAYLKALYHSDLGVSLRGIQSTSKEQDISDNKYNLKEKPEAKPIL